MKEYRNKYHFYKKDLKKLFKVNDLIFASEDEELIDKIINILTEGRKVKSIKDIVSNAIEIKYGEYISNDELQNIEVQILNWWESKK